MPLYSAKDLCKETEHDNVKSGIRNSSLFCKKNCITLSSSASESHWSEELDKQRTAEEVDAALVRMLIDTLGVDEEQPMQQAQELQLEPGQSMSRWKICRETRRKKTAS